MENNEASAESLDLEDCNLGDDTKQSAQMSIPAFDHPTHMRVLDLEVISTLEFPKNSLLYANTLRSVMIENCI